MSDSGDDLIARADALLSRWRAGSATREAVADFPVLTDFVDAPEATGIANPPAPLSPTADSSGSLLEARLIEAIESVLERAIDRALHARIEHAVEALRREPDHTPRAALTQQLRTELSTALLAELRRRDLPGDGSPGPA